MIDLTPLDVRNKRGDFKKGMRGYDPQEVDVFLELVAERLEALVRENIQLRDRTRTLEEQVNAQAGREQAVQDALVTAQELRKDIREQSQREADHLTREAESEARRIVSEAEAEARARVRSVERQIDHARDSLQDMERRRTRFLQEFRGLLQRELDVVEVEEERMPLEDRAIDLDLGMARRPSASEAATKAAEEDAGSTTHSPASEAAETTTPARAETDPPGTAKDDVSADPEVDEGSGPSTASADGDVSGDHGQGAGPTAGAESTPPDGERVLDADVGDLTEREGEGTRRSAPAPEVGDQPSSLELELMAGAAGSGSALDSDQDSDQVRRGPAFPDVPDLETVLAEAGIDEVRPPDGKEISPPPPDVASEDHLALFEEDEEDGER